MYMSHLIHTSAPIGGFMVKCPLIPWAGESGGESK